MAGNRNTFGVRIACCLAATLSMVSAVSNDFDQWRAARGKHYADRREQRYREQIYLANKAFVEESNAKYPHEVTFTLAMNEYADVTAEEFGFRFGTGSLDPVGNRQQRQNSRMLRGQEQRNETVARELQSSLDWVTSGAVNPPVAAGACGSHYAFAAAGSAEGAVKVKTGTLPKASVQELMDCSSAYYNAGCSGGYADGALWYIVDHGVAAATSYGYTALSGSCLRGSLPSVLSINDVEYVVDRSESDLLTAIGKNPTTIAINSATSTFQLYSGGILGSGCSASATDFALAVGWGSQVISGSTVNYIKARYNLGTSWGEGGYIRFNRNPSLNSGLGICAIYACPVRAVKT